MARRHHIKRGSNILPDPYESDWVPKNTGILLHRNKTALGRNDWRSSSTITPGNYDSWIPGLIPFGSGFNEGFWPSWTANDANGKQNMFVIEAFGTFPTIDCDEISWFQKPLCYHGGLNTDDPQPSWITSDQLKDFKYFDRTDVPNENDFLHAYGGYFPWGDIGTRAVYHPISVPNDFQGWNNDQGYRVYDISTGNPQPEYDVTATGQYGSTYNIKNWEALNDVTGGTVTQGATKGIWRVPETNDVLQLIGQLPKHHEINKTGDRFDDIKAFFLAKESDDPIKRIPDPVGNNWYNDNISGLGLLPNGKLQSRPNKTENRLNPDHFGVASIFATFRSSGNRGIGYTVISLNRSRNTTDINDSNVVPYNFAGMAVASNWGADGHNAAIRYCRVKTAEEKGYKLVIEGDKVLVVDPTDSRADMPIGMERGIALRYMNRKHRVVLRSYSQIQTETTELLSTLSIEA